MSYWSLNTWYCIYIDWGGASIWIGILKIHKGYFCPDFKSLARTAPCYTLNSIKRKKKKLNKTHQLTQVTNCISAFLQLAPYLVKLLKALLSGEHGIRHHISTSTLAVVFVSQSPVHSP